MRTERQRRVHVRLRGPVFIYFFHHVLSLILSIFVYAASPYRIENENNSALLWTPILHALSCIEMNVCVRVYVGEWGSYMEVAMRVIRFA